MAVIKPIPGEDAGEWGNKLNSWIEHIEDKLDTTITTLDTTILAEILEQLPDALEDVVIISATEPDNPNKGTIWLDTSS